MREAEVAFYIKQLLTGLVVGPSSGGWIYADGNFAVGSTYTTRESATETSNRIISSFKVHKSA